MNISQSETGNLWIEFSQKKKKEHKVYSPVPKESRDSLMANFVSEWISFRKITYLDITLSQSF